MTLSITPHGCARSTMAYDLARHNKGYLDGPIRVSSRVGLARPGAAFCCKPGLRGEQSCGQVAVSLSCPSGDCPKCRITCAALPRLPPWPFTIRYGCVSGGGVVVAQSSDAFCVHVCSLVIWTFSTLLECCTLHLECVESLHQW